MHIGDEGLRHNQRYKTFLKEIFKSLGITKWPHNIRQREEALEIMVEDIEEEATGLQYVTIVENRVTYKIFA